jgi:hypothetical protein
VTAAGLRKLANAWTLETGNRVNIISGTIGLIKNDVMSDMPGDLVLLPQRPHAERKGHAAPYE